MINQRYKIAISETLHYLNGIKQDDIHKIPDKFMNFLKANKSKNYECDFDYTKPLNELQLMDETRAIIGMICLNYWCETEEQKIKFRNHLNVNEQAYQETLKIKYNGDDIFKRKDISHNEEIKFENINQLPIKLENENIFKRLRNSIMKLFNKK